MSFSVNLGTVVFTALSTPTSWTSTRHPSVRPTSVQQPTKPTHDMAQIPFLDYLQPGGHMETPVAPVSPGTITDPLATATATQDTATRTLSIIHNHIVIATFTVVGGIASPPRGVPPGSNSRHPYDIMIMASAALGVVFIVLQIIALLKRWERATRDFGKTKTRKPTIQAKSAKGKERRCQNEDKSGFLTPESDTDAEDYGLDKVDKFLKGEGKINKTEEMGATYFKEPFVSHIE
ncbi:hypothetical protein ABW19_dt0200630 [Dactylella cylindrospora]|nr:hypothetical protein ABW19_dt0200630 [Dactylella cylindrospora]